MTATQTLPQEQIKVVTRSNALITIPNVVGRAQPVNTSPGQSKTTTTSKPVKKKDPNQTSVMKTLGPIIKCKSQAGPAQKNRSQTRSRDATCSTLDLSRKRTVTWMRQ